jgi:hypothetical protein
MNHFLMSYQLDSVNSQPQAKKSDFLSGLFFASLFFPPIGGF